MYFSTIHDTFVYNTIYAKITREYYTRINRVFRNYTEIIKIKEHDEFVYPSNSCTFKRIHDLVYTPFPCTLVRYTEISRIRYTVWFSVYIRWWVGCAAIQSADKCWLPCPEYHISRNLAEKPKNYYWNS